ncbi:hypothetical protein F5I97DRAFT_2074849 [Phlebopus sp. FC_14]|nr:hypothetical protein F5I97DRAFT_2074849 [Phlebopus sp. FC_14]
MAPKKSKASKMSLNEFLGDSTLGSWADEMDALPTAPSVRTDEDKPSRPGDRFARRDDFASSRPDRQFAPPREDLPLPAQPPYTAFVGNLAFDITESELENFFSPHQAKSIKIIKDRDDKPKGFGYIEFVELDALKDALSRTGTSLSGRTVRVSVAEPPKERPAFAASEDESKFSGNWRREGPISTIGDSRDSSRRRFDGPPLERAPPPPSISDEVSDWRSSRPLPKHPEPEAPSVRRRGSGFSTPEAGAADREETWSLGNKFKPTAPEELPHGKFGSSRGKYESVNVRDGPEETDWRSSRTRAPPSGNSPSSSTPPTPQLSRKKLELLPRSSGNSTSPSPMSSPKLASNTGAPRSNPFGAARLTISRPVDISSKEREIALRLEKERERAPLLPMSRTSSRQATERGHASATRTPPVSSPTTSGSPAAPPAASANVRPSISFANVAGSNASVSKSSDHKDKEVSAIDDVTSQVAQIST